MAIVTEIGLYDLKLHETTTLGNEMTIMRVVNGWIYKQWVGDEIISQVYVPQPVYCGDKKL